jgi:hypothetical protein
MDEKDASYTHTYREPVETAVGKQPASPVAQAALARRTGALFQAMGNDFLLREQFVTDPAQIVSEYVMGVRIPAERAIAANTFIYSVLSNPRLVSWLREYSERRGGEVPLDRELLMDFGTAIAGSGDAQVVNALIVGSLNRQQMLGVEVPILGQLFGGGIFVGGASGTERSPDTGTEMSPGTGTEMSPGTGTEMSPGTGTEMSPGTGTEASPGTGTEASPGTGTEASPGTGTESEGRWGGLAEVSLQALIEYASQLRETGALEAALAEVG